MDEHVDGIGTCWPVKLKAYTLVGGFRLSKLPMRINDGATRVTTAAFSGVGSSRWTSSDGYNTMARERVVGIPSAFIAARSEVQGSCTHDRWLYLPSAPRYSRIEERNTARPSAVRLNGVRPAPFS